MSPLQKLKNGILNSDWNLVCEAYNQFTGEELKAPINSKDDLDLNILSEIEFLISSYREGTNVKNWHTPISKENKVEEKEFSNILVFPNEEDLDKLKKNQFEKPKENKQQNQNRFNPKDYMTSDVKKSREHDKVILGGEFTPQERGTRNNPVGLIDEICSACSSKFLISNLEVQNAKEIAEMNSETPKFTCYSCRH